MASYDQFMSYLIFVFQEILSSKIVSNTHIDDQLRYVRGGYRCWPRDPKLNYESYAAW